ncbi:MAG TPA: hypothetical protein V6C81_05720 [Planktothrix sp.]|jgi:hypothetical protein
MSPNPKFDKFFSKAKDVGKQAADQVGRQAKKVKLQTNIMTLKTERGRHITTIGNRAFSLFSETNAIDGKVLLDRVRDEIAQIERIDSQIREIESEIADLSASTQHVDVQDVTESGKEPGKE